MNIILYYTIIHYSSTLYILVYYLTSTGAKKIQGITDELTDLTNPVVSTALKVNKDPNDRDEQQKLHDLRRQWAEKVQKLTTAIDEIIGAWEFTAASGTFTPPFIHQFMIIVYLSIYLSIHLSIYLSIYLSVMFTSNHSRGQHSR